MNQNIMNIIVARNANHSTSSKLSKELMVDLLMLHQASQKVIEQLETEIDDNTNLDDEWSCDMHEYIFELTEHLESILEPRIKELKL